MFVKFLVCERIKNVKKIKNCISRLFQDFPVYAFCNLTLGSTACYGLRFFSLFCALVMLISSLFTFHYPA